MKIAIAGLLLDSNLGDVIIIKSAENVYENIINRKTSSVINWSECDLDLNRNHKNGFFYNLFYFISIHWIKKHRCGIISRLLIWFFSHYYDRYISECEFAIIAGGGLIQYKYLDCSLGLVAFCLACYRAKVPVIINAIGCEGYDDNNSKCQLMKWGLKFDNIVSISCRDDVITLNDKYLENHHIKATSIPCSAIFCRNLLANSQLNSTKKIGIGLIRKGPFVDYGSDDYYGKILNFYVQTYQYFEKINIEVEFFTNGWDGDLFFVSEIEKQLGRKIILRIPENYMDLIHIISGFSGIISARLHSLIVAYSLNIPVLALVWHKKVELWLKKINMDKYGMPIPMLNIELVKEWISSLPTYSTDIREKLEKENLDFANRALNLINNDKSLF